MGFRKILKKYKRWTGDEELHRRFNREVTSAESSFYKLDLEDLLEKYIDALDVLRAIFDTSGAANAPGTAQVSSPASQIAQAVSGGSEVDFDLALSITPLGSRGSKATYWIHPDQIVEVEVLLLQHMRLRPGTNTSTPRESRTATPKRSLSPTNTDRCLGNADETGLLILDHPELFAIKQNASTIGSSEETAGTLQAKAAGNVRWSSSSDDAAIVVGLDQTQKDFHPAKLKRKYIAAFLDTDTPFDKQHGSGLRGADDSVGNPDSDNGIASTRQWLAEHKDVKPIAGICSKRTRFVSLHNSSAGGMWATLDNDICMKDSVHKNLSGEAWVDEARSNSKRFPHAVLEVRREGNHSSTLIQTLDRSYLVRGTNPIFEKAMY
jgi:SPX domain protein involved in polyphosphate accumulation